VATEGRSASTDAVSSLSSVQRPIPLPDRTWPSRVTTRAPRWCSVDLRDGNQALIDPWTRSASARCSICWCGAGSRRSRSASRRHRRPTSTSCACHREGPDSRRRHDPGPHAGPARADRAHLRIGTRRAAGARAPLQLDSTCSAAWCSASTGRHRGHRVRAAQLCRKLTATVPGTDIHFQYSPESFTGTELDFAKQICEAVMDVWEPTVERPVILNLPATVEMATPNIYGDQIEWFHRNIRARDTIVLSLQPPQRPWHRGGRRRVRRDGRRRPRRGHAVRQRRADRERRRGHAGAEPLQPGRRPDAELLGHRRRPAHGRALQPAARASRHPYVGDLVYTRSPARTRTRSRRGSKRSARTTTRGSAYLPVDPHHLGRSYEAVNPREQPVGQGAWPTS